MPDSPNLFWQLMTGRGPVGGIMAGIGVILCGVAVIGISELIYYAATHPVELPPSERAPRPPSRELTPDEYRGQRLVMDAAGIVVLAVGARKLVRAAKGREV